MKKFLVPIICLVFFVSLSNAGLLVDPSVTNVKGVVGSGYNGKYLVTNNYDKDIDITVTATEGRSFSANKDIGIDKWLKLEKSKFFIPAGESVEVPYEITICEGLQGSVSSRIEFAIDKKQGEMIGVSIIVPIYVVVEGTENIDFDIEKAGLFTSEEYISYMLVIENKGNVHIRHTGLVEIYDKNKKNLIRAIPLQQTIPTYCEQKGSFSDKLLPKKDLKKGKYIAVFKVGDLGKEVTKEINFKVLKDGMVKIKKK